MKEAKGGRVRSVVKGGWGQSLQVKVERSCGPMRDLRPWTEMPAAARSRWMVWGWEVMFREMRMGWAFAGAVRT